MKVSNHAHFSDYRPINLIGCTTKVFSKTLAERLKLVVGKVISNDKIMFVRVCNILDHPLVVKEIISWAKKAKKK